MWTLVCWLTPSLCPKHCRLHLISLNFDAMFVHVLPLQLRCWRIPKYSLLISRQASSQQIVWCTFLVVFETELWCVRKYLDTCRSIKETAFTIKQTLQKWSKNQTLDNGYLLWFDKFAFFIREDFMYMVPMTYAYLWSIRLFLNGQITRMFGGHRYLNNK